MLINGKQHRQFYSNLFLHYNFILYHLQIGCANDNQMEVRCGEEKKATDTQTRCLIF